MFYNTHINHSSEKPMNQWNECFQRIAMVVAIPLYYQQMESNLKSENGFGSW